MGDEVPKSPLFAYAYDAADNLTAMSYNGKLQSYEYTSTNQLAAATYDAAGNPLELSGANLAWDAAGRLIRYERDGHISEFTYDGLSRLVRIVERDKGQVVADHAWTWCGSERCLERDNRQDGSPVTKRYFAQGFMADGKGYYTVTDPLGSVRQVIDAEGKVQAEYDYTPWGYRFQKTGDGSVTSDIGFAGYFHHATSGYDFALYRAYDSMHRRWLNRDPIGEAGGMNLYAYVNANPTSYVDPEGLFQITIIGADYYAAMLTFGYNHGQFNFGVFVGIGEGFSAEFDPHDRDCNPAGLYPAVTGRGQLGLGPNITGAATLQDNTRSGEIAVRIPFTPVNYGMNLNNGDISEVHTSFVFGEAVFVGFGANYWAARRAF